MPYTLREITISEDDMWSKFIQANVKLILLIAISCFLMAGTMFVLSPFPKMDSISVNMPKQFSVPINTGFELQGKNQCSAYSTAFVLRNCGQSATGSEVYNKVSFKIPISGYVLPKGVISYLKSKRLEPIMYKGDLGSLKQRLVQENNLIIVLVGNGFYWQHYMTLVGFNEEKGELYFFDSNKDKDENAILPGNRTLTNDYFLKWWNNGLPIFNHVYISVR
jgi:hypothetical protein